MVKRQTITGSTLRPQSTARKAAIADALHGEVWPLLEAGKVKPIIDTVFMLEEASKAHTMMEANQNIGKILLRVKSDA
jgi:NADPH2:quinone reductase